MPEQPDLQGHYSGTDVARQGRWWPWRSDLNVLHQYWILGLGVDLNPSAGVVQHRNAVLIVDLHSARMRERLLKRSTIMRHGDGTLTDHVRVGHQLLFAPLRQLMITLQARNKATVRCQNLD